MRPILVFDTSPLFNFGHRGEMTHLLQVLAESHDLIIPPQVAAEARPERGFDYATWCRAHFAERAPNPSPELASALMRLRPAIGDGELAVLTLAAEIGPRATAVIDERVARKHAVALKLPLIGTIGLLMRLVTHGCVSDADALACVRRLCDRRFNIPDPAGCATFSDYALMLNE